MRIDRLILVGIISLAIVNVTNSNLDLASTTDSAAQRLTSDVGKLQDLMTKLRKV